LKHYPKRELFLTWKEISKKVSNMMSLKNDNENVKKLSKRAYKKKSKGVSERILKIVLRISKPGKQVRTFKRH